MFGECEVYEVLWSTHFPSELCWAVWETVNIIVYWYISVLDRDDCLKDWSLASFCVVLVLPTRLAVCLFYLEYHWEWLTFKCESRFDVFVVLIFCTTDRSASWTFSLPCLPQTQNVSKLPISYPWFRNELIAIASTSFSSHQQGLALTAIFIYEPSVKVNHYNLLFGIMRNIWHAWNSMFQYLLIHKSIKGTYHNSNAIFLSCQ